MSQDSRNTLWFASECYKKCFSIFPSFKEQQKEIVPKSSFQRLKPYKDKLLYLTQKKANLKQKKEALIQKGCFLTSSCLPHSTPCCWSTREAFQQHFNRYCRLQNSYLDSSNKTAINIPPRNSRHLHAWIKTWNISWLFHYQKIKKLFLRSPFASISRSIKTNEDRGECEAFRDNNSVASSNWDNSYPPSYEVWTLSEGSRSQHPCFSFTVRPIFRLETMCFLSRKFYSWLSSMPACESDAVMTTK